ncbi:MAG: hypothetical protein OXG13_07170 [Gemmatimonadaceae bacterium]|nr:hypothetical protein [Gemmatimonadaceae bacterium]
MESERGNDNVRFEPDERPPHLVAAGVGFQAAVVVLAPVVLGAVIIGRAGGQGADYITWIAFAALVVSGVTTVLQAVRVGRIGAGHVLIMGTSGAFIAVCITALAKGGPPLMASLIVVSALFQFALAARLSLLRRVITPVVSGTVIMLIAVTVMPIIFGLLTDVPEGTSSAAAPSAAVATFVALVVLALRAPAAWRLWAPLIGIAVGCAAAAPFGLYDIQSVIDAPWIGLPDSSWPGLDLSLGPEFWALLPAFVVVTIVGAIETIGDGVAIQRVSRRRPRATDFRLVQGALNADGVGNLLSGLVGTPPNTTYSSSISLAELTGVAARRVGVYIGVIFVALALSPKVTALVIAIPNPVAAVYVTLLIGMLFVQGMKIVVGDGLDHRKAAVVGLSFWIGVGFQNQVIFADLLGGTWGTLLGNGMTAGGMAAIALTAFMELTAPRRRRLEVAQAAEALPEIDAFLQKCAARVGWGEPAAGRLRSAGEETLAVLLQQAGEDEADDRGRRLILTARLTEGAMELEFSSASSTENLEDQLAYMSAQPELVDEREISFRLLRHYATSVRHQKYHDVDIVTVQVEESP